MSQRNTWHQPQRPEILKPRLDVVALTLAGLVFASLGLIYIAYGGIKKVRGRKKS